MKPAPFAYHAPDSVDEVLSLLAEHGDEAKVLAGGQSLVPTMNFRLAQPGVLIDLNRIPQLAYIEGVGSDLLIGAMTRQREVEKSDLVAERSPLVTETLPWIAHPQIRNRGTFGGALAHADPAAELPAVALTLGARFRARGPGGERWIDAGDYFTGLFETALEPDELLVEIALPELPARTGWAFREVSRRRGDYALVGVAAVVTLGRLGRLKEARITFLSVGEGPVAAVKAQEGLRKEKPTTEVIAAAAATAASEDIDPTGDIHASEAYRRHLARVLTVDVLTRASLRARGEIPPQSPLS